MKALRRMLAVYQGRPRELREYVAVAAEVARALPTERAALLALERAAHRSGDFTALEEALRDRLAGDGPAHEGGAAKPPRVELVRARLGLAAIARRRGDEVRALEEVQPLLTEAPGHRGAACAALLFATRAGRTRERADALVQIAGPSRPALRSVLLAVAAELYERSGAEELGRRTAEQACEADPACARAVASLSAITEPTPDRVAAAAVERAMTTVLPRGVWCGRLARAFDELGEPALAFAWTQRWLALRPGSADAMAELLRRAAATRDGAKVGDALGWVLAQPRPLDELAEPIADAVMSLIELDRSRARALARRALDVLGPRVPLLRARLLELSRQATDPGLAIAVLERYLATGTLGNLAGEVLLELGPAPHRRGRLRRRRAGARARRRGGPRSERRAHPRRQPGGGHARSRRLAGLRRAGGHRRGEGGGARGAHGPRRAHHRYRGRHRVPRARQPPVGPGRGSAPRRGGVLPRLRADARGRGGALLARHGGVRRRPRGHRGAAVPSGAGRRGRRSAHPEAPRQPPHRGGQPGHRPHHAGARPPRRGQRHRERSLARRRHRAGREERPRRRRRRGPRPHLRSAGGGRPGVLRQARRALSRRSPAREARRRRSGAAPRGRLLRGGALGGHLVRAAHPPLGARRRSDRGRARHRARRGGGLPRDAAGVAEAGGCPRRPRRGGGADPLRPAPARAQRPPRPGHRRRGRRRRAGALAARRRRRGRHGPAPRRARGERGPAPARRPRRRARGGGDGPPRGGPGLAGSRLPGARSRDERRRRHRRVRRDGSARPPAHRRARGRARLGGARPRHRRETLLERGQGPPAPGEPGGRRARRRGRPGRAPGHRGPPPARRRRPGRGGRRRRLRPRRRRSRPQARRHRQAGGPRARPGPPRGRARARGARQRGHRRAGAGHRLASARRRGQGPGLRAAPGAPGPVRTRRGHRGAAPRRAPAREPAPRGARAGGARSRRSAPPPRPPPGRVRGAGGARLRGRPAGSGAARGDARPGAGHRRPRALRRRPRGRVPADRERRATRGVPPRAGADLHGARRGRGGDRLLPADLRISIPPTPRPSRCSSATPTSAAITRRSRR